MQPKRTWGLGAAMLSLWLLAAGAGAQEIKMHRKDAGQLDKTGWALAESTGGRFSVYLPMKFNDFTTEWPYPAPAERTYEIAARSADEIRLSAARVVYRKGASTAREYFARFEKGRGFGAAPDVVSVRRVGNLRAVDLLFRRPDAVRYQRVVLLESDLVMMSVELPPSHADFGPQLAGRFFESLLVDPQ